MAPRPKPLPKPSRPTAKKPKFKRGLWSAETMKMALEAVKNGILSQRKSSLTFKVPRKSLQERLNDENKPLHPKAGRKTLLSQRDERKLADYAAERASLGIGFGKRQFLRFAGDLAHKRSTPFKKSIPSEKWWRLFKKRHTDIVKRSPEPTSTIRHQLMNKVYVGKYFDALKGVFAENNLLPESIWNMDETGFNHDHAAGFIIARRGSKYLQTRTSGKQETITIIATINASGKALPPHIIVKGKTQRSLQGYDLHRAPTGAKFSTSNTGWTKQGLAKLWFETAFLPHIGSERPQLLILDGHDSHCFVELIAMAREENIIMVELPAHCSHWLQPLDRTVFSPFKNFYNEECREAMSNHANVSIKHSNVMSMITPAWVKAFKPDNIISGFRACGIHPFNPEAIPAAAYKPNLLHTPATVQQLEDDTDMPSVENMQTTDMPRPTSVETDLLRPTADQHKDNPATPSSPLDLHNQGLVINVAENGAVNAWACTSVNIENIGMEDTAAPVDLPELATTSDNTEATDHHDSNNDDNVLPEGLVTGRPNKSKNCPKTMLVEDNDPIMPNASETSECPTELAFHALCLSLAPARLQTFINAYARNKDIEQDRLFATWKKYKIAMESKEVDENNITTHENDGKNTRMQNDEVSSPSVDVEPFNSPLSQGLGLSTKTFYKPRLPKVARKPAETSVYNLQMDSDEDVLPMPLQTNNTSNVKKRKESRPNVYFVLTADEVFEEKKKAAMLKEQKEQQKKDRQKQREEAKIRKEAALKDKAVQKENKQASKQMNQRKKQKK